MGQIHPQMAKVRQCLIRMRQKLTIDEGSRRVFYWVLAKSFWDCPMKHMVFKKALTIEGDFWVQTGMDQKKQ